VKVARIISSRSLQRDSLLFVYGTLRPFVNIPMARWLQVVASYVGPAKTRGRLYDLGPYPGLTPAQCAGEWVAGDLYRVRSLSVLRALDRYESGAGAGRPRFLRRACVVYLGRRPARVAWVYMYQRRCLFRARIAHGDFRAHRSPKPSATLA
jgi:gamma-glutamylcyclotransferase (GGCT)/AIG2-like uncharacterized protein YtfP